MNTRLLLSVLACPVAALVLGGCSRHSAPRTLAGRLVHGRQVADRTADAPRQDLAAWIAQVRELQASARPEPQVLATAETHDPALREAVARAAGSPTSANQAAVGVAYYRAGVLDAAEDHLTMALRLDVTNAAANDLRARIWRDWGFPGIALGDAHRAVYYAPRSPEARNTLGTVFVALGRIAEARAAYLSAVDVDPAAGYAWSNLCRLEVRDGRLAPAALACRRARAVAATPTTVEPIEPLTSAAGAAEEKQR